MKIEEESEVKVTDGSKEKNTKKQQQQRHDEGNILHAENLWIEMTMLWTASRERTNMTFKH